MGQRLAALLGRIVLVIGVDTDPGTLAALCLVFIAALTLPHVAIVTWMDRAEGTGLSRRAPEQ